MMRGLSLLPLLRPFVAHLAKGPRAIIPIDPREQAILDYLADQRRQRDGASRGGTAK